MKESTSKRERDTARVKAQNSDVAIFLTSEPLKITV